MPTPRTVTETLNLDKFIIFNTDTLYLIIFNITILNSYKYIHNCTKVVRNKVKVRGNFLDGKIREIHEKLSKSGKMKSFCYEKCSIHTFYFHIF